jgi:4-azaleucine resistance transporter AzlC
MTQITFPTRRQEFLAGMKDTIPMIIGAMPFGIIFGALAVTGDNPLTPTATMGMSLFVFAGSSQFIGMGLYSQGIGLALIIFTTFIVNLRHALYAASLAPYMRHVGHKWLLPLGFWLTDETYAVVIRRFQEKSNNPYRHWYYFGSAIWMYTNWQLCTLIGIIAGQQLGDATSWGLDFAMVVTFIGIIVPLIINRPMLFCAIVAALVSLSTYGLPNKLSYMVGGLAGIIAGLIAENWQARAKRKNTPQTTQPIVASD